MKNKIFIYLVFTFITCYSLIGFFLVFEFKWEDIDLISVVSLILYLIVIAYGLASKKNFATGLIFVFLGFPSNINNFIPGFYLGNVSELGAIVFPFFTHIELFMMLGIFRYKLFQLKQPKIESRYIFLMFFLCLSFFINLLDSPSHFEMGLMLLGSYQIRILLLLYVIINSIEIDWFNSVVRGAKLSISFLFIESVLFSIKTGQTSLVSGSLGANTFGNIMASLSLFFFVSFLKHKNKRQLFWALVPFLMAIGTGTRMSVLAFLAGLLIYKYSINNLNLRKIAIIGSFILLLLYFLPEKFNIFKLVSPQLVESVYTGASDEDFVEVRTSENSSIITRLLLFRTSVNMIIENPFFGIGSGKWNYLKNDFGFPINVLIDSHNGYLAVISQYGIFPGILFIIFILIKPAFGFTSLKSKSNLFDLSYISLVMFVAEFSNAGIFKIQVFTFLAFIAIVLTREKYISLKR